MVCVSLIFAADADDFSFTFPRQNASDFVSFDLRNKPQETFHKFTFCLWLKTNQTGSMVLVSYATDDSTSELILRVRDTGVYELVIHGQKRYKTWYWYQNLSCSLICHLICHRKRFLSCYNSGCKLSLVC